MNKIRRYALCLLSGIALLWGCSKDNEKATFSVRLTDAPADYQEVNVDIREVHVHTSSSAAENDADWIKLDAQSGVYNLLELTNGLDVLLAEAELPAGKLSQIRLVLGENNTLKQYDQLIALKTPSAQQSGLKLSINADLEPGKNYTVLLDFDAGRSVVKAGNSGSYILKPVIRALVELQKGMIAGKVVETSDPIAVMAINNQDTVGTYTNENGEFKIMGLDAGSYSVVLESKENKKTLSGIAVTLGETSDLKEISLIAEE